MYTHTQQQHTYKYTHLRLSGKCHPTDVQTTETRQDRGTNPGGHSINRLTQTHTQKGEEGEE